MIIEAVPKKLKRSRPAILQDVQTRAKAVLVQKDFVEYGIKMAKTLAIGQAELSLRTKIPPESLKQILAALIHESKILNLALKLYIHSDTVALVQQRLLNIVSEFHSKRPESPGMSFEQFSEASGLEKNVFNGLVRLLISQGKLTERNHRLALPDHRETFSEDEQKLLETVESLFSERPFNPPKCEEIIEPAATTPEKVQKILQILIEQERLVRVENNLLFHCKAIDQARQILISFINKEGRLESVKFKYLLDTSRKFAIPLLDYFDSIGLTRRIGNTRYLKTPVGPVSDS